MQSGLSQVWTPPQDVTRHAGSTIPEDMDFFAAPPSDIGQVITADSSLKTSSEPLTIPIRIGYALGVGLVVAGVVWLGCRIFGVSISATILAIIAGIVGFFAYLAFGFEGKCSFVGDRGIAEFTLKGSRSATLQTNLLTFQSAGHLHTSQTRRFKNGSYRGTTYSYQWTRRESTTYVISGEYHSKEGNPNDDSRWHFANSAEAAWTGYLLPLINQDLNQRGYVEFPMAGNPQIVRVGQGFLEFVTKRGETQRAAVSDMKDVRLNSGHFQFNHKDARWWSGQGKYSFTYGNMPNARLFLMCLQQLAGVTWN